MENHEFIKKLVEELERIKVQYWKKQRWYVSTGHTLETKRYYDWERYYTTLKDKTVIIEEYKDSWKRKHIYSLAILDEELDFKVFADKYCKKNEMEYEPLMEVYHLGDIELEDILKGKIALFFGEKLYQKELIKKIYHKIEEDEEKEEKRLRKRAKSIELSKKRKENELKQKKERELKKSLEEII